MLAIFKNNNYQNIKENGTIRHFATKHCFPFLLGPFKVPRETGNEFGGTNKEYYGIFRGVQPYKNKNGTAGQRSLNPDNPG